MAKKSTVSCLSVLKADCATRAGMIEVLQSLAPYCPVAPSGWHPPLVTPTVGPSQNTMVCGDYGFWEMGGKKTDYFLFMNLCAAGKVLFSMSGEKGRIARMAGLVPVLQQWHKKKV